MADKSKSGDSQPQRLAHVPIVRQEKPLREQEEPTSDKWSRESDSKDTVDGVYIDPNEP